MKHVGRMTCHDKFSLITVAKTAIVVLLLAAFASVGYGGETYYIDDSPLHLYKTINWWYDSTPQESTTLCGKPIKCTNEGNARIEYDEINQSVELKIKGGFASLLLAFKTCEKCYGPSSLKCVWRNQKYIKSSAIAIQLNKDDVIDGITFINVKKEDARQIMNMVHGMLFVLEGVIGGLSNSRIAMHESAELLKYCHAEPQLRDQSPQYPISLKILNANTNETLALFSMTWSR